MLDIVTSYRIPYFGIWAMIQPVKNIQIYELLTKHDKFNYEKDTCDSYLPKQYELKLLYIQFWFE